MTLLASLLVLFLAGCSEMVGQSFILFVNRVPLRRFALCLVAGGLFSVFSVSLWTLSIWILANFFTRATLVSVFVVVSLGHAPRILGALAVIPHFGLWLARLLRIYVFLAVVAGIGWQFELTFWQSLVCCTYGGLVEAAASYLRLFGLEDLQDRLWSWASGAEGPWPSVP
ncbi:MAG: hypothetical protein AB7S38_29330 [Vulcanimicrobiota bacterium]